MVGGDDARGQPAGRSAACDHDMLDPIAHGHGPVVMVPAIVTKEPLVGGASGSTNAGLCSSLLPAELVPRSDHVARSGLRHEQRLAGGAAVNALDLVSEVDRLGLQRQVFAPLVTHIEVELTVFFGVIRVRSGAVEAARQELVAPVVGETHAPAE